MASNKFGIICDICGKYSDLKSSYYKMKLPTWNCEMNNSLWYLDYCPTCYKKLKLVLAKYYKIKWAEERSKKEEALNMAIEALNFDIDQYYKEHFVVMVDEDLWDKAEKALEQEPILDKIRAEIVEMWQHEPCAIESGCLDEVLEVIDKYKAESEE